MKDQKIFKLFSGVVVLLMLLSACGPAAHKLQPHRLLPLQAPEVN